MLIIAIIQLNFTQIGTNRQERTTSHHQHHLIIFTLHILIPFNHYTRKRSIDGPYPILNYQPSFAKTSMSSIDSHQILSFSHAYSN